jgi:hypothetical protein
VRRASIALLTALVASPALAGSHHGTGGNSPPSRPAQVGTTATATPAPRPRVAWLPGPVPVAPEHRCEESTDVVGMRECDRFGSWADDVRLPAMSLSLGANVRQLAIGGAAGPAPATAIASALRLGWGFGAHTYVAAEGELGRLETTGTTGSLLGLLGVVGVRTGLPGAQLAAELAGGSRGVYGHDVMLDAKSVVIEPRVRSELWIAPRVSLAATLGTSLVERRDWMVGVSVGVHGRAYGGGL